MIIMSHGCKLIGSFTHRRHHIPYFERFYDWVYEKCCPFKCCPFSNRELIAEEFRRDFYLVQLLPESIISAIMNKAVYSHALGEKHPETACSP